MAVTIILGLLAITVAALAVVQTVEVRRLRVSVDRNTDETRALRLTSRARIATASMQSGAVSDEQKLERLGRASAAHRVVVGGDDSSQQKQQLRRQSRATMERRGGQDE